MSDEYETLLYQARAQAEKRPCGSHTSPRTCDKEFPGRPSRWCSGCLIAALLARLEAKP